MSIKIIWRLYTSFYDFKLVNAPCSVVRKEGFFWIIGSLFPLISPEQFYFPHCLHEVFYYYTFRELLISLFQVVSTPATSIEVQRFGICLFTKVPLKIILHLYHTRPENQATISSLLHYFSFISSISCSSCHRGQLWGMWNFYISFEEMSTNFRCNLLLPVQHDF